MANYKSSYTGEEIDAAIAKANTALQENDVADFITKDVDDLTYYELKTNTGSTIELSINTTTYVVTLNLKNSAGTILSTGTIDLPLESVVVNGSYDSTNKKVILTLQNGSTIEFSVADLVSGLQNEITSSNKLSSDLVDDTNQTNKFVTANEKQAWDGKYVKPSGGIPKTDLASDVQTSLGKADTAIQDISGKQNVIDSSHKLSADLVDDTNTTNKFVTASDKSNWNGKLDASKVKSSNSTTSGDVYDVTYINTMLGNIETLLSAV